MGMPGPVEFMILLFLLAVGAVVLFLVGIGRGSRRGSGRTDAERDDRNARQILDDRYAKGELARDEYQQSADASGHRNRVVPPISRPPITKKYVL